MVELIADLGADVEWLGTNEVRIHAASIGKHELDEELCRQIRASFLLAGPLLARLGRALRAATGRRRDRSQAARPAHPRLRRARSRDLDRRSLRHARDPPPRHADLPRRGERHGDGEHDHGGGARPGRDGDLERRLRAARPGSLPLPQQARRLDRGHRLERAADPRRRSARRRRAPDRARAHRGRELHRPRRRDRQRPDDHGRGSGGPGLDPARVRAARCPCRGGGDEHPRAARPGARRPGRPRRPDPEDRGRPLARLPRRPDVDRGGDRDPGPRHDPRLREDVREPPVLRRQAGRDGRAHHPLRPAPRGGHRAGEALRRAPHEPGHPRRAWRC